MSTWHRKMTVDIFSDEASSFRVSEIFVPALGVRQENFIICLFDVFSQVIGLNSVCFKSRKVTVRFIKKALRNDARAGLPTCRQQPEVSTVLMRGKHVRNFVLSDLLI